MSEETDLLCCVFLCEIEACVPLNFLIILVFVVIIVVVCQAIRRLTSVKQSSVACHSSKYN